MKLKADHKKIAHGIVILLAIMVMNANRKKKRVDYADGEHTCLNIQPTNHKHIVNKVQHVKNPYLIRNPKILDGVPTDVTFWHPPKLITILQ